MRIATTSVRTGLAMTGMGVPPRWEAAAWGQAALRIFGGIVRPAGCLRGGGGGPMWASAPTVGCLRGGGADPSTGLRPVPLPLAGEVF